MKILVVAPASNSHTVKWVNQFHAFGNEVYLTYLPDHKPAKGEIHPNVHCIPLKHSGSKGYYLNAMNLHSIANKIKPDMIHVHYASGYGTLARVSKVHPVVLSVWGSDVYEFPNLSSFNKKVLEKNLKKADYITSTSHCMKQETLKYTDKPIPVVPFGIDTNIFKKLNIEKNPSEFVISTFKSLEPIYGLNFAIKGVHQFIKKYGNQMPCKIQYRIYGSGSQEQALLEQIRQLKLEDTVSLMGRVHNTEIPEILNQTDVALYTSLNESFGVSLVEAMACQVPVVASVNEGFCEVLENGKYGKLIDRENPEQIADTLYELYSNPELRNDLIQSAEKKARREYAWDENVKTMLEFFETI